MESNIRIVLTIFFVFLVAQLRLLPHPPNLVPMTAICLFAGAQLKSRWLKWTIPLAAILVTDCFGQSGFSGLTFYLYFGYALIVVAGIPIKNNSGLARLLTTSVCGTLTFFVVSNFGFWHCTNIYEKSLAGFVGCYFQAIPFLLNSIVADTFYVVVIFTVFDRMQAMHSWSLFSRNQVRT